MDSSLVITVFLMALIVAVTAGLWARSRGARPLMGGIGVLLIPLGLYLLGITELAYNGVISLITWAQRTVWSPTMTWGVSLAGVGVLMFLASRLIKPAERRVVEKSSPSPQVASRPAAATPARTVAPASVVAKPEAKQAKTSEDDEVEDILRKRGLL
ncbi:hypothetical protein [Tessaracoccus sp.]